MARFFIDRPVFAWVIAIFLIVAGVISITQLPVAQYPSIASPSVNIRLTYPGASAELLDVAVTNIIEQELNGIPGLKYYESSSEANGTATITATFVPGTNQDLAAVEIQNRLKRVEPRLPPIVLQMGLNIEKAQSSFLCMVALYSPTGAYNNIELGDYLARNVLNEIKRLPGVGQAQAFATERAIRVWLDPDKLVGLGISVEEVNAALASQNVQITAGTLGRRPTIGETQITVPLLASGQLRTADEFANFIILRSKNNGAVVRLKDVATVEMGGAEYAFESRLSGKPSAIIAVQLTPTGNALNTANLVRDRMDKLRNYFPRDASGQLLIDFELPFDTSPFINVSIMAVVRTLLEAVFLVFVVMFLFLQNIRYTFIPIIVVPVALLGTFAVLLALNFSVNVLTMFGMVLVIGILVDDAIVVVENVERIMREELLPPREATQKAMKQITGAIIGMTLVLASVFIPMAFFPGAVGVIYRQFSLTMVASILFSALLALTLTPALCANLLRTHEVLRPQRAGIGKLIFLLPDLLHQYIFGTFFNGFAKAPSAPTRAFLAILGVAFAASVYFAALLPLHKEVLLGFRLLLIFLAAYMFFLAGNGFNNIFNNLTNTYERLTRTIVRFAFVLMLAYAAICYGFGALYNRLPTSFIPMEDQGSLMTLLQLPPGASANRTIETFKKMEAHYINDPAVKSVGGVVGFSFAGAGENAAMMFVSLKPWHLRGPEDAADKVAMRANMYFATLPDKYIAYAMQLPAIPELGITSGVDIRLQDRGNLGHDRLLKARNDLLGLIRMDARSATPTFSMDSRPDGIEDTSQRTVTINREVAAAMGVPFNSISSTLGTIIGSSYINEFPNDSRMQRVIVQGKADSRLTLEQIGRYHVRNVQGGMVPLSTLLSTQEITAAAQLVRYNGYPTMRLSAIPAPGRTTGELMVKIREFESMLAKANPGIAVEWTKQALEEEQSGAYTPYLVAISLLFVFLLMAALYESWSIPLSVMLVVPIGALGAVTAVSLRQYPNDIYFLIGMIAIIGLSTKNAILIIEFAKEQQLHGKDLISATVEGARLRFRPILMTSFAFILGVWPLFTASGAASASQRAIGTGVIGGMIAATLLGVFFIPAFYVVVRKLTGNRTSHYDKVRQDEWSHGHTDA